MKIRRWFGPRELVWIVFRVMFEIVRSFWGSPSSLRVSMLPEKSIDIRSGEAYCTLRIRIELSRG